MITQVKTPPVGPNAQTIWGLTPMQLHDRFWAARGVQTVRLGSDEVLSKDAELFLLTDPNFLTVFRMGQLNDTLSWLKPTILFVRLHNPRDQGYNERVITDSDDRFVRFERVYGTSNWRLGRFALTPSREIARMWQQSTELKVAWRRLRRTVTPNQRTTMSVDGSLYDSRDPHQVMDFIRELVGAWKRPDATISRARKLKDNVWSDVARTSPGDTRFIGPVWVGSGRSLDATDSIVGPAVLWDDPTARPKVEEVQWNKIEPSEVLKRPVRIRAISGFQRGAKRAFDIAFAVTALASTMWLYPFIALAVFIESGRPVHFKHRRESKGGREFSCLKFRTMRRDADQIKARLVAENVADGPQFYIENDPRVTRIGRFLRSYNLDELPQFLNVLMGDMSIVGPRPSPYKENQYCPPWREARLSVRPGITGLWQVMRSRERGKDFQEWIRYDIEYVENMNWKLDLKIIWLTIAMMLKIRSRPNPEAQANGDPATAKLSAD